MKNGRNFSFFYFVTVVALITVSTAQAAAEEYIARAVSVSGKVLVRAETAGAQMTFLKAGDKLFKGTILNTGSNGAVKLLMTDRTILDLGPSSLFKVNDYQLKAGSVGDRTVDMSLDYGTVRASVNEKISSNKGKFTIRTKAATMGVRGTEFVVNAALPVKEAPGVTAAPPKTSITVMHGKVEVADSGRPSAPPVAITPGFQFAKSGDGPGGVAQLKPQEVAQVKSDAFQKDMTFMQAVSFDTDSGKDSKKGNDRKDGSSDKSGEKSAEKSGEKSGDKAGDKMADGKSGGGTKSPGGEEGPAQGGGGGGGGKQTIENIGMNIETHSNDKTADKPSIGDLNLPGVFSPSIPQQRPIDQKIGGPVNLRVVVKTQ